MGLRELARMVPISPTYLSKLERGQASPPREEKVRKIAEILACDPDELLAKAGRVSTDLAAIIRRRPVAIAALLRIAKGLSDGDLDRIAQGAQQAQSE